MRSFLKHFLFWTTFAQWVKKNFGLLSSFVWRVCQNCILQVWRSIVMKIFLAKTLLFFPLPVENFSTGLSILHSICQRESFPEFFFRTLNGKFSALWEKRINNCKLRLQKNPFRKDNPFENFSYHFWILSEKVSAFWWEIFGRIVQAAFCVSQGSTWVVFFEKVLFYLFRTMGEKISKTSHFLFRRGFQNCILPNQ